MTDFHQTLLTRYQYKLTSSLGNSQVQYNIKMATVTGNNPECN